VQAAAIFFRGGPNRFEWYRRGELCLVGLSRPNISVSIGPGLNVVEPDAAAVGLAGSRWRV